MGSLFHILIAFQGKIVGRGVLIDYYSYAMENGIQYSPIGQHPITAQALEACVKAQGLELQIGDILFIRMGYVSWYENASEEERVAVLVKTYPSAFAGVHQGQEEVEWLWCVVQLVCCVLTYLTPFRNNHFAAVAADSPSFEVRPSVQDWDLHEYILALWGVSSSKLCIFAFPMVRLDTYWRTL